MLEILRGRPGRVAAQIAVVTVVAGGALAYTQADKAVKVSVDGRTRHVHTFSGSVGDLLEEEGVRTGQRDLVSPARGASLHEGDQVVVRFGRPLQVTVDGQPRTYWTTELTVDRALAALGLRAEGARLSASRSTPIQRSGLALSLSTPKKVSVAVDGRTRKLVSAAPTVSELLTEQSIRLGPLDKVNVVPSSPVVDGLVVAVTRIEKRKVTKKETVAFKVVRKSDRTMAKGTTKVVTPGRRGKRTAVYEVTLADGKVTGRRLVSADVTRKPVTQVVKVGTKAVAGHGPNVGGNVDSLNWPALARCESGGNPNAVNPAGYYGLYQFSISTWHAVGGTGKPTDFGSGEQTYRAKILYKRSGAGQWPNCGRLLFT